MENFKFFQKKPLVEAHDGGYIYADEWFYTLSKVDTPSVVVPGKIFPKYTITDTKVTIDYQDQFVPDHERLWYFKSRGNAEYLREIWKNEDDERELERYRELYMNRLKSKIDITRLSNPSDNN